jgi:cytosine deaminase
MNAAIEEAELGMREGGIPIGSVLVHQGRILGRGHNRRVQRGSAILHGEMDALENAGRLSAQVYRESVLYTTLSPCAMCSGAILFTASRRSSSARTRRLAKKHRRARGVPVTVLRMRRAWLMADFIRAHPDL